MKLKNLQKQLNETTVCVLMIMMITLMRQTHHREGDRDDDGRVGDPKVTSSGRQLETALRLLLHAALTAVICFGVRVCVTANCEVQHHTQSHWRQ